ncbi:MULTISPECIES: MarR family winged helix-turn-helix transcriptional regulator [Microbacterium]|uniref:MarR family winged helix-turn-helix transcriptional regulator n=1 Tax=Microbacterium TaxID=33882 RepID=UPI00076870D5|nr:MULTISPECIES: MarR family transcriptional regulator [Microbacterium]KXC06319.1 transcriptional regulator [Microbacterium hominis]QOC25288.1 MarR family transcriptional regulator [Microbacterium hominis]QYF98414.1 MarR family transcriptional regulator [Microbacterium sp. PAMC21962]
MQHTDDILRLLVGAHALTRVASLETRTEAPAAQWRTLVLLRDNGPLRIGDLATLSRVTQPGMTRLVTQMAEAGLVERTTDPGDSRATLVSATDAGMSALDEWLQVLSAALAPRFADLDEQEWATIRRAADIVDARTRVAEVAR